MRTDQEIDKQITLLKQALDTVPERSFFGGNNHEMINGQIDALEERMTTDVVYEEYGDPDDTDNEDFDENLFYGVLAAVTWLEGHSNEAPGDGWTD